MRIKSRERTIRRCRSLHKPPTGPVTATRYSEKKGRRTDAARRTPAKGQTRTAWPTPLSGRGPEAASSLQEPKLSLADFSEAVERSRVVQVVFIAVRSARRVVFSFSRFRMGVSQVARRRDHAGAPDGAGADAQEPVGGRIGCGHQGLPFPPGPARGDCRRVGEDSHPRPGFGPSRCDHGGRPATIIIATAVGSCEGIEPGNAGKRVPPKPTVRSHARTQGHRTTRSPGDKIG